MSEIFDDTPCELGEGPLWHPTRKGLFWFDILNSTLNFRTGDRRQSWVFDEMVSAAGWVDDNRLLIASETALLLHDLVSGKSETLAPLEADNPATRSNDGRADPWGGFWIGTMGKAAEAGAGAIYRYYRGEVRRLFGGITIPNAICFSPDGGTAHFTDTRSRIVQRQRLDEAHGWPKGDPEPWLDLRAEDRKPDGAVVDAQGNFWNAQWGSSRVACYDPAGHFQHAVEFGAAHTSCPAFGGPDLTTLFCTSAREGLSPDEIAAAPANGKTFVAEGIATGQAEHRVVP